MKVQTIPAGQALAWLQTEGKEERTLWVERYRSSDLTFGQVAREEFIESFTEAPAAARAWWNSKRPSASPSCSSCPDEGQPSSGGQAAGDAASS